MENEGRLCIRDKGSVRFVDAGDIYLELYIYIVRIVEEIVRGVKVVKVRNYFFKIKYFEENVNFANKRFLIRDMDE